MTLAYEDAYTKLVNVNVVILLLLRNLVDDCLVKILKLKFSPDIKAVVWSQC